MRAGAGFAALLALAALAGCGGSASGTLVLRMGSADPAGIEHDPAVAFFAGRVARLSRGGLRIALDERWGRDGWADEASLLRAVARGEDALGSAHSASFGRVGVDSFDALDTPQLVDSRALEAAVLRSPLAARMLVGVRAAGLRGLALLAGPMSRPVGTSAPLRSAEDFRGLRFGLHRSNVADMAVRALGAHPVTMSYDAITSLYIDVANRPGPPAAMEDDLDSVFFDRYGGACNTQQGPCDSARPWVTSNVVLWPRPAVLVANPRAWHALSGRQRAWLAQAASDAARRSLTVAGDEQPLVAELCPAGVRFATASRAARATLRRAWRPVYAALERRPALRAALRRIAALRRRVTTAAPLRVPAGCTRRPAARDVAHGVPSPLPDGVYRARVTADDLRAVGDAGSGDQPGTVTLTLRGGRWRLEITEPGEYVETGTYAGTPLRTAWLNDRNGIRDEAFFSVVPDANGLRFHVARAEDLALYEALYASHRLRRIGR